MSITAFSGPIVQFGTVTTSTAGTGLLGADLEHNEQRGPMVTDLGDALLDPRAAYSYAPGSGPTSQFRGLYNQMGVVDYVPTTASTVALVQNTASSGVSTFTLVAASSALGTYATTIIAPETGKTSESLLAIDSTAAYLTFGSAGTVTVWNPAAGTGRCITITPSSNLDAGTYSVAGRDMYGYKMTETVTAGSTNLRTQKAFKYISSITNTTTPTSTGIQIGISNVYGMPLLAQYYGLNCQIASNSSASVSVLTVPSTSTTLVGSTVATQTSTTPDVRGIWISSVAANNVVRVQIMQMLTAQAAAQVTSTNVAPMFGATQFSSV